MKCGKCGFENPDLMRFCGNCGNPLVKKKRFAELKEVAIIFIDMVGYTTYSEGKDPEEVNEALTRYWKLIAEIVDKYDCHIDKYMGDAVLILCGYPRAHENDVERAVLIAQEFLTGVYGLNMLKGEDIQFRVGVHYGKVYAGEVGSDDHSEETVIGDPVNTAERIQSKAKPGTIAVSQEVESLTKLAFTFEKMGDLALRGKEESSTLYKVIGRKSQRGKFRGIEGLHIPMVGRDKELASLLDKFKQSFDSKSISETIIMGNAGLGKTRLTSEFLSTLKQSEKEKLKVLKGRCLPYGDKFINWPILDIIKNLFELKDNDEPELAHNKIRGQLIHILGDIDLGVVKGDLLLMKLLGLEHPDIPADMKPEKVRELTILILTKILTIIAKKEKLVLIIEDLHWIDYSSVEILESVLRRVEDLPIMVIFVTRPEYKESAVCREFVKNISGKGDILNIELSELSPKYTKKMVEMLLEVEKLPEELKAIIVRHSEGNPFFTEEIIKCLIDRGVLVNKGKYWKAMKKITDVDIPKTVQAVIQTRIDTLTREDKSLLQSASVIGKVFLKTIIKDIFPDINDSQLQGLLDRNLIEKDYSEIKEDEDAKYKFKHILIQEVVYNSILKKVKSGLHLKIAEWIERTHEGDLASFYDLLGYHFERGGEYNRAVKYLYLAGERARKTFANSEGELLLKDALDKLKYIDDTDGYAGKIKSALANIDTHVGKNDDALKLYMELLESTEDLKERRGIQRHIGEVYQRMSEYESALEWFHKIKDGLVPDKDVNEIFTIDVSIAWIRYLQGSTEQFGKILFNLLEMIDSIDEDDILLRKRKSRLYNLFGIYYANTGKSELSTEYYQKNIDLNEELNDIEGLGVAYNNIAGNYSHIGDYIESLKYYKKSLAIAEQTGDMLSQAITTYNLGQIYLSFNVIDEAEEYLRRYMYINRMIENNLGIGYGSAGLGSVCERRGEFPAALEYYEGSYNKFTELGSRGLALYALSKWTRCLIKSGELKEAAKKFFLYKKGTGDDNSTEIRYIDALLQGAIGDNEEAVEKFEIILSETIAEGTKEDLPDILKIIFTHTLKYDTTKAEKIKNEMIASLEDLMNDIPEEFQQSFKDYYLNI
ncbi:tetratricopeptide repeat protein [bacterium]|nr:tetratricopeptide repeat protein [bacterium]